MNIDKDMIRAAILAAIIYFMRQDIMLALIIAVVAYFMPRLGL
jgi:hypothetical protein